MAHEFHVGRAADCDDMGAPMLRDLNGEMTDTSCSPDNENALAGRQMSMVAKGLQGRPTRQGKSRCLNIVDFPWQRHQPFISDDDVFGAGAIAPERKQ